MRTFRSQRTVTVSTKEVKAALTSLQRDEPPQKISKLAIAAETEEDHYETKTRVDCYECNVKDVDTTSGKLPGVIDGVLKANTFSRQAAVKAWELEMTACEHTLSLQQASMRDIASQGLYLPNEVAITS